MRRPRAGWLVTACVAVVGCSSADALTPNGSGTRGDAATTGSSGTPGGSAGASPTIGGTSPSGGSSAAVGGGSGSTGSGGAVGGALGAGMGGMSSGSSGAAGLGASSTGGAGGSGGTGKAGQTGAGGAAPTFTEVWNRTLENGCAIPYCHDGSGKGWNGFDKATAYRTLAGAASTTCPGETRVVAGNPDASVLAAAISHIDLGSCDVPMMPRDRPKLPQADIDRIIAWIRAGAKND